MIEKKIETAGDYQRAYYLANREKLLEYHREYYAKNREKILEKQRRYRAENREKLRQYSRDYYHWAKKNPEYREKLNACQRERYRRFIENPETCEKARAHQKAYRQRKKAEKIMDEIERECEKMADMTVKAKIEPVIHCGECRHAHMTADRHFCKYCDKFPELNDVYFDKNFYC